MLSFLMLRRVLVVGLLISLLFLLLIGSHNLLNYATFCIYGRGASDLLGRFFYGKMIRVTIY